MSKLGQLPRYISCVRVTKRPIFWFTEKGVNPNDSLSVFPLVDDYSFGILQSSLHWEWFKARCSTLKGDPRYTSDSVFDSFPWPQEPTLAQVRQVADAAVALQRERARLISANNLSLRDLYRTLETPGQNSLRDVTEKLSAAVRKAYGLKEGQDALHFLLDLNTSLVAREAGGLSIQGPGLPTIVSKPNEFISSDCLVACPTSI